MNMARHEFGVSEIGKRDLSGFEWSRRSPLIGDLGGGEAPSVTPSRRPVAWAYRTTVSGFTQLVRTGEGRVALSIAY